MEDTLQTWHRKHQDKLTFGQRVADKVAGFMGSWEFIIGQSIIISIWIGINITAYLGHWDPYPFILLNLLFSTQAAYAAPIIMMAQNRQSERDRIQARDDYETNIKAKKEIEELQLALNRIENEKLDQIIELLKGTKK
jgi:uncharacterized membrane protein